MSGPKERFEGGCLCGAVRFIATGEQKGMYWCHCQSYRKHIGAPVAVLVGYQPKDKFTKGEITKFDFDSRENAARLLRQVRIDLDLRIPSRDRTNSFPRRSIRSGGARLQPRKQ